MKLKPVVTVLVDQAGKKVLKLNIFGKIGSEGCMAVDIKREIESNPTAQAIEVEINSNGGSYMQGLAMYQILKEANKKVPVTTRAFGMVASAATLPMCAGQSICPKDTWLMVHNPSAEVDGDAADLKAAGTQVQKLTDQMADIYAEKSGTSADEWKKLMAAETYMTGAEAKDKKLIDLVSADLKVAASVADAGIGEKAPKALKDAITAAKAEGEGEDKKAEEDDSEKEDGEDKPIISEGPDECHAANLKAFHTKSAKAWAKNAAAYKAESDKAKEASDEPTCSAYAAIHASAMARAAGHEAKAEDDPTKHLMAEGLHMAASKAMRANEDLAPHAVHHEAMARYHAAMAEQVPAKEEVATTEEVKPVAEDVPPAKEQEAKASRDPRAEFKAMASLFGDERAGKYFGKGMTVEQAKDSYIGELKAEQGRLAASNAELQTKLNVTLKNPLVGFSAIAGGTGETKGKPRVDLAEFEAYCKRYAVDGKKKEELWDKLCGPAPVSKPDAQDEE